MSELKISGENYLVILRNFKREENRTPVVLSCEVFLSNTKNAHAKNIDISLQKLNQFQEELIGFNENKETVVYLKTRNADFELRLDRLSHEKLIKVQSFAINEPKQKIMRVEFFTSSSESSILEKQIADIINEFS